MGKIVKSRNWAFVVYPDSAPSDWIGQLKLTGLQCAISPLHDADENADGTEKKPHWHVIAVWGNGSTTFNNVKNLTDSLNAPIPQALAQIRGYYRYLTHKDNPEKKQYDEKDIQLLNGFNIADFMELSRSEITETKKKLQGIIRQEGIIEYSDLMDYLLDNEQFLEYDVACNHTIFFDRYITSRRHKCERYKVNPSTGEVISE